MNHVECRTGATTSSSPRMWWPPNVDGRVDTRVAARPPSPNTQSTKQRNVPSAWHSRPPDIHDYVLQAASTNRRKHPSTSTNGTALLTSETHAMTWVTDSNISTRKNSSKVQPEDDAVPPVTGVALDGQEHAREVTDEDLGNHDAKGAATGNTGSSHSIAAASLGAGELPTKITVRPIFGAQRLANEECGNIGTHLSALFRHRWPRHHVNEIVTGATFKHAAVERDGRRYHPLAKRQRAKTRAPTRVTPSKTPNCHRTAAASSPTETTHCEAPSPGVRIHAHIVYLSLPSEVMHAA